MQQSPKAMHSAPQMLIFWNAIVTPNHGIGWQAVRPGELDKQLLCSLVRMPQAQAQADPDEEPIMNEFLGSLSDRDPSMFSSRTLEAVNYLKSREREEAQA